MKRDVTDPSERAGYLLWQTAHTFGRAMDDVLDEFDLTPAQFGILVHAAREPGVSSAELARRINVTPQSIQTALRPLEHRGLLERHPHPVHRKVLGVVLTDRGHDLAHRADVVINDADAAMLSGFTDDEVRQFHHFLRRAMTTLHPAALDRSSLRSPRGPDQSWEPPPSTASSAPVV